MESKELRIGNLTSHGTVYKIHEETDLDFKDTVGCMDFMGGISEFELETVNPISLTKELLDKFGFKKDVAYTLGSIKIWHSSYTDSFQFRYGHDSSQTIEYVHQLQNLYFALTGEELTI